MKKLLNILVVACLLLIGHRILASTHFRAAIKLSTEEVQKLDDARKKVVEAQLAYNQVETTVKSAHGVVDQSWMEYSVISEIRDGWILVWYVNNMEDLQKEGQ